MGDVGLIKVVSVFGYGRPKSHFRAPENSKSAHFHVPKNVAKNGTSGARTKHETTFISTTSPKNDGIAFGFKRVPLLDIVNFYNFWAIFHWG